MNHWQYLSKEDTRRAVEEHTNVRIETQFKSWRKKRINKTKTTLKL